MFEQILTQNGLTSKEASLYLSVLEAGEMTYAMAAKKAHLKRSTVYGLVDGMKDRGILSVNARGGIKYLSALTPRLLIEHFENSAAMAKSILPQLMELAYSSPIKPRIRFYDGKEGIKRILFDAASSRHDYIGFIDYTLMPRDVYRYIREKVAPERRRNRIILRLLMPDNPVNRKILTEYKDQIEHRLVDFSTEKNHVEILIYDGSKIGFMSFVKDEMFGVVVDSKGIYQTLHDLFMLIWNQKK